jgi:hypothetical protein
MNYYRSIRRGIAWGCSIHKTPRGIDCQGCDDQAELFTRADTIPQPRIELPPTCRGCGLYPNEHCHDCGNCPDWHHVDCPYAPGLVSGSPARKAHPTQFLTSSLEDMPC